MLVRRAVLLIPSLSSRPIHSPSSRQIAHESPQFPVFTFKRLRTLPSSVSSKSCVCHSYANFAPRTVLRDENCRVTSFKLKVFLSPRRALSSLFSFFAPRTFHNSSLFRKICTLSKNSRVCTNNSQCGAHLRRDNRHPRSFFSCTYELQIFELLCFDIHTNWWGGVPPSNSAIIPPRIPGGALAALRPSLT
jgi:hypothetical protein